MANDVPYGSGNWITYYREYSGPVPPVTGTGGGTGPGGQWSDVLQRQINGPVVRRTCCSDKSMVRKYETLVRS